MFLASGDLMGVDVDTAGWSASVLLEGKVTIMPRQALWASLHTLTCRLSSVYLL